MKILVGTDIESTERFQKIINFKSKLLKNIFFENEINYALNKVNSSQSLTGIWCAKESVVKSFSEFSVIAITDVEIICRKGYAPSVIIHKLKNTSINYDVSISISHTRDFATAIAVLVIKD
jgi:holo-[acyl-carrier protein] synthase